ncbi:MAG TPA: flagellar hook-basal body complex protein FliE [Verrucomicrobiae bacterium]|jgi:flagellar hook-basal body complex protein FliE|nr:flagellar hook-basal body complex protein FliE [Verrucomicrobiae bacterium]
MSNPIQGPITGLASISAVTQPAGGAGAAPSADSSDFLSTLDTMMSQASGTPTDYETQVTQLLQGNGQDLHSAMIAVEKADLSFQLMMQVRNKIIAAYQTISQIPF